MTIILCLHAVNTKIFTMHYFCEKLAVFFYQMGFSRFNFSLELRFLLIFFCTFFFFVCSKDLSLNSFAKICCYLAIRLHMKSLWTILPINHVKSKESPKVPWPHQFLSFFSGCSVQPRLIYILQKMPRWKGDKKKQAFVFFPLSNGSNRFNNPLLFYI